MIASVSARAVLVWRSKSASMDGVCHGNIIKFGNGVATSDCDVIPAFSF